MCRSPASTPDTPPSNKIQSTGIGGQSHRRTSVQIHTACCGPRPGPAPAADRPADAAPHDTSPANNNSPEEMRTSCRQQPDPLPRDTAKMSPRISIRPEPVLTDHVQSPPAAGSHCPARKVQLCIREQSFSSHISPVAVHTGTCQLLPATRKQPSRSLPWYGLILQPFSDLFSAGSFSEKEVRSEYGYVRTEYGTRAFILSTNSHAFALAFLPEFAAPRPHSSIFALPIHTQCHSLESIAP